MGADVPLPGRPVRGSETGQPIMAAFDLLGRAWALGVLWHLEPGQLTFRELQSACGDASPSLMSRRLKELRTAELVDHRPGGYVLTALGADLVGRLATIGTWADAWAAEVAGVVPPRSADFEVADPMDDRQP